jgi:hypothetical protein
MPFPKGKRLRCEAVLKFGGSIEDQAIDRLLLGRPEQSI